MHYRFTLETYKGRRTRFVCPNCGKIKEFTRYIDTQTGNYLADHVGRCNRAVNCGYHYTPNQYFADNKISPQKNKVHRQLKKIILSSPQPISFIPFETFSNSLMRYKENNFIRHLLRLFDTAVTSELIRRFYIGTSSNWEGSTVFWQIDCKGHIRTGKIMLYDSATGKRVKEVKPDGSKQSKITWVHSVLQKQRAIQDFNLRQCLFGEHQLSAQVKSKPVAIVESEKTAIIATVYLPEFIWLACGSMTNLTADKCGVLRGRKVALFPDLNSFERWRDKAKHLQVLLDCDISVSNLLETRASEADRMCGFDLADYLVEYQFADNKLPDEIYVPACVANTVEAITHCIGAQQRKKVA